MSREGNHHANQSKIEVINSCIYYKTTGIEKGFTNTIYEVEFVKLCTNEYKIMYTNIKQIVKLLPPYYSCKTSWLYYQQSINRPIIPNYRYLPIRWMVPYHNMQIFSEQQTTSDTFLLTIFHYSYLSFYLQLYIVHATGG